MLKSMTGYGKEEGGGFVVEMRSVNHKFLDLSVKLPRDMLPLENRLKRAVSEKFSRGRMEVYVTRGGKDEVRRALRLDTDAAKQYIALLSDLKTMFDLPGEIDLGLLTSFKDIVSEEEVAEDVEQVWGELKGPLAACMDALDAMRREEGTALGSDINDRAGFIASRLDDVEAKAPTVVSDYAKKLRERVARIAEGVDLDRDRLHQEVAIYADRCDITEELVRGRSHLGQLKTLLKEGGPVGRKMDFLIQELFREINTIGSKASDREIAHKVVEAKAELEKIREQVQNIE